MANDRLFIRCTKCGDYAVVGKYYPSCPGHVTTPQGLAAFVDKHLDDCQLSGLACPDYGPEPICIVLDSESTFCAAGGVIGGTGNISRDMERYKRNG